MTKKIIWHIFLDKPKDLPKNSIVAVTAAHSGTFQTLFQGEFGLPGNINPRWGDQLGIGSTDSL